MKDTFNRDVRNIILGIILVFFLTFVFAFILQQITLRETNGQCDQGAFVCFAEGYGCSNVGKGICDGIHQNFGR